jgi:integrase
VGAFSALRWGELARLRRPDVLDNGNRVKVRKSKSAAGEGRIVTLPPFLADELRRHMLAHVAADPDALIFTSPRGFALNHSNFGSDEWRPTLDELGYDEMKFHDLRHFAGTTAAQAGATVKEVMKMLGHSTPRAAMIYQHAAEDRAAVIAEGVEALAKVARQAAERAIEKATAESASAEAAG